METKKFEIEVPLGKTVYAVVDEGELFYAVACSIVGASTHIFLDEVETVYSTEVLEGKWRGQVLNDNKYGDADRVYTLWDDKASAQDVANDLNRK